MSRSKSLLKRFATFGLDQVLFSDKKIFTVEEVPNSQNDRILSQSISTIHDKFRYVKRVQKPLSVMVWAGVSAVGRTPLVFVPPGVKINALTYQDLILKPFLEDLERIMFNNKPFLSTRSCPRPHCKKYSRVLRTEVPSYISKLEWPPSSPDLNPLDFSLWSILESRDCSNFAQESGRFKEDSMQRMGPYSPGNLATAVEAVPRRLREIIKKRGGYIE